MPRLSEFRNTLAIAMWDFTYIETHVKGGAFEDYDKCLDELAEHDHRYVSSEYIEILSNSARPLSQKIPA